jgi:hypothetical protein
MVFSCKVFSSLFAKLSFAVFTCGGQTDYFTGVIRGSCVQIASHFPTAAYHPPPPPNIIK